MSATMTQLLTKRQKSLGIRPIEFTVATHLKHDPGCRVDAAGRLRGHRHNHRFALVMFDKRGCGKETDPREAIQNEVELKLEGNGWTDRSKAIVIDPELEAWVWNDSPHTARILGWKQGYAKLRAWLHGAGLWPADDLKPPDPKEAFRRALRTQGLPRSSKMFVKLAGSVGLSKCQDPAFMELKSTLSEWFPK